ncbi:hypothetical protein SAMN05192589_102287 [Paracidovorax valerianellae]|uniref:Uncharacterized protein n=1 Tax=Paracidovorax valerianellae TaxID=187868 RepID=A0A1G6LYX1_9BURK|nr:hypothetical protein [Paracidovorax valerianellae]SDC48419.1 hypothetical protein SAMN05192589_102287 [Paracidovorax valerianellae]
MRFPEFKKIPCIVWCLALNAVVVLGWLAFTPRLFNSYNSPRYVYRLEIHDASLLQRAIHYEQKIPSLVRLYHVNSRTLLRESEVVDLWMNGDISWHLDPPIATHKVYVGRDVLFDNIPSECADPSLPPDCPAKP